MTSFLHKLGRFWNELKRRRVIHVFVVYGTAAVVIIDLATNIEKPLHLPEWTSTLVIVLLSLAFPVIIALSWIYNISAGRLEKTEPLKDSGSEKSESGSGSEKENSIKTSVSGRIENSIAVLPFQDMSPEKDQGYFCEGIAEEILNILSHMENLKVVARTSSFVFRERDRDIREIGRKLEVRNILEGSIRKSGNRIRITAQLIDAVNGLHIWSEKYDRDITDVFAIQDEISQAIVHNLSLSLEGPGLKQIEKYKGSHIEAYLTFLKGNYHYQFIRPDELKKAIEYYSQSMQSDPEFAPAYVGIARSYWSLTYFGNLPPNQAYPVIIDQMSKAKQIDGTLDDIHFLEGVANYTFLWNFEEAERSFQRAIEINPNSAYSHSSYSMLLTCMARHEDAISEAMQAAALDPMNSYIQSMVINAYNFAGSYEEGITFGQKAERNCPEHFMFSYFLGFAYHGLSEWEKAIASYEKSLKISGGAQLVLANLILAYIEMGKNSETEELLKDLNALAEKTYVLPTHFYKIHHARGEGDLAFEWFRRALREHDGFVPFVRIHPYKQVRFPEEKRYSDLLKDAGFKDAQAG